MQSDIKNNDRALDKTSPQPFKMQRLILKYEDNWVILSFNISDFNPKRCVKGVQGLIRAKCTRIRNSWSNQNLQKFHSNHNLITFPGQACIPYQELEHMTVKLPLIDNPIHILLSLCEIHFHSESVGKWTKFSTD